MSRGCSSTIGGQRGVHGTQLQFTRAAAASDRAPTATPEEAELKCLHT